MFSSDGLQLLLAVPVYTLLISALGLGLSALIPSMFGGQMGSLLYFAAICLAVFCIGTLRLSLTDPTGSQAHLVAPAFSNRPAPAPRRRPRRRRR